MIVVEHSSLLEEENLVDFKSNQVIKKQENNKVDNSK
jgi:hypothetical protein